MGGKGAAPSNNQMVQFEMQQAAEARAKEEKRKARLEAGKKEINELFGGTPIYGTPTKGKLSLEGVSDPLTAGVFSGNIGKEGSGLTWRFNQAPADVVASANQQLQQAYASDPHVAQQYGYGSMDILDKEGKVLASGANWADLVSKANNMEVSMPNITGYEGGFGEENFYNPFKVKDLAYYLPQVKQQYGEARHKTGYDLMRAGLYRSTAANQAMANIYKQGLEAEGMARRRVDQDVAQLRNQINSEQKSAMAQLEAQEDPDVAATGVINYVNNQKLAQPDQPQLGDLFKPLVIGAIGAANTYNDVSNTRAGFNARSPLGGGAFKVN